MPIESAAVVTTGPVAVIPRQDGPVVGGAVVAGAGPTPP